MTRKALLVGINDDAPAGPGGPDLHGCVNDVKDFANTLGGLSIVPILPASIRILTDRNAARENILAAFPG
jgi:metacaspase-1